MCTKKTERRLFLEKADLITLIKNNSFKQISKMFDCSVNMVHVVCTKQISKLNTGFKKEFPVEIIKPSDVTASYKDLIIW